MSQQDSGAARPLKRFRDTSDRAIGFLEHATRLDGPASKVAVTVERLVPSGPVRDFAEGRWMGHPLHPMLTDLPIGSWTSAWVLDVVGDRRNERAAQLLVGFGCISAIPTAVSGAVDWLHLDHRQRRVGVVHAASNLAALTLYTLSWNERRVGRHASGVALGLGRRDRRDDRRLPRRTPRVRRDHNRRPRGLKNAVYKRPRVRRSPAR